MLIKPIIFRTKNYLHKVSIIFEEMTEGKQNKIIETQNYLCECCYCSYKGKCNKFVNPEEPKNKYSSFMDACLNVQEKYNNTILIPREGELDKKLKRKGF